MKRCWLVLCLMSSPCFAWQWNKEDAPTVLPSLQEEYEREAASYQARVAKGMSYQERLVEMDRIISQYKPRGVNTLALETERDRVTISMDEDERKAQGSQKVTAELYQLALQKAEEGRFLDALSAARKAERLLPEDKTLLELRHRLESVSTILPQAIAPTKAEGLVRKGVVRYVENDGVRALNALYYAALIETSRTAFTRLVTLVQREYPAVEAPVVPEGKTLADFRLQKSLEYVYNQEYLKAMDECHQVLDLEPNNILALTRLGSVYYAMGQKTEARAWWEKALRLDPENAVLKDFLRNKL